MSLQSERPAGSFIEPRAPWKRWRRPIAAALLAQLVAVGCGGAARPPATEPTAAGESRRIERQLGQYSAQLAEEGITLSEASAYLSGTGRLLIDDKEAERPGSGDSLSFEPVPAFGDLPAQTAEEFDSWKVIDGVAEYRVGPQDVVRLIAYVGPEARMTTHRVQADGTIFVPRFDIDTIKAAGLTATELSRELSAKFRQFAPMAYVDVRIDEYNAWEATLAGEVYVGDGIGPGTYELRGRITAGEFIFAHGGPTPGADLADVRLVRDGVEYRIDLEAALNGRGQDNPPIDTGDLIRVPSASEGRGRYFIFGEVRSPGIFTATEGLTVLDALAQAGSPTSQAKADGVFISRPTTGETIPVDLTRVLGEAQFSGDASVLPGDFIVVPVRDRTFWEKTRDWIGLTTLVISTITIIELFRRD